MLRFPLAVLVVFIHSSGSPIDVERLQSAGFSGTAVYDYLRIFISSVIASCAVPLFFFFSGFLFFKGVEQFDHKMYRVKLRKRWHSLARPYLIWNILRALSILASIIGSIIIYSKPWSNIGDYFAEKNIFLLWNSNVWGERATWLGIQIHNSGPVLSPFWYMRDLIVMVVLSPIVYWLVKRLRVIYFLLALALYLADIRVSWCSATMATAWLFFSIGAYFSLLKKDFTQVLWRWRHVVFPLATILIIAKTVFRFNMDDNTSQIVYFGLVVALSFAFIIIASVLSQNRYLLEWSKRLAPTSFFIYAVHPFIIEYVMKAVAKLTPMSSAWYMQCIDYIIAPLVCISILIMAYIWGRRLMPSTMNLLIGERQ